MRRLAYPVLLLALGGLLIAQPASPAVEISCNGAACNQFGSLDYNYILMNTGDSPVTVTEFYVATNDLDAGNYSAFSMPAGFQAHVDTWEALDGVYGVTEKPTTGTMTDHGVLPAAGTTASAGAVLMTGGTFTLQPGGTIAFGFNHDWDPYDMGWVIEHPDDQNFSEGSADVQMAGPWETSGYNQGFVHGVGHQSTPTEATTWSRIKTQFGR